MDVPGTGISCSILCAASSISLIKGSAKVIREDTSCSPLYSALDNELMKSGVSPADVMVFVATLKLSPGVGLTSPCTARYCNISITSGLGGDSGDPYVAAASVGAASLGIVILL